MVRPTKRNDASANLQEHLDQAIEDLWDVALKYVNNGLIAPAVFIGLMETVKATLTYDAVIKPQRDTIEMEQGRAKIKWQCTDCGSLRYDATANCPECGSIECRMF